MLPSVWGVICAFLFFAACNKAVSQVDIDQDDLIMSVDESSQLTAKVLPENASVKTVTWSSSDEQIVSVSSDGKVNALKEGKATITARSGDQSDAIAITVATPIADGAANCYIISTSGIYSFKTLQGNSSKSVGSVASAALLWESFGTGSAPAKGDIVAGVAYYNGTIAFTTPSPLKNGNAVIAAKNASGDILWSWHIWVCKDFDPNESEQSYNNGAGTMMDRNLGATSATPGDVGALGLLYQWGRKDPFLGSSSISSITTSASTINWPSPVSSDSDKGTIDYAVANPTTFIKTITAGDDWMHTPDNNLWQSSKTIYDPCPSGWRVPEGGGNGVWAKAASESGDFSNKWDSDNKGMDFSGKFGSSSPIWYPAAGYLAFDGDLTEVGARGGWWSCTPQGSEAYRLFFQDNGNVGPLAYNPRSVGHSVRCIKD